MEKTVIWAPEARDQYQMIVEYWNIRNQSDAYSNRIHKNLKQTIQLIAVFPELGRPTSLSKIRAKTFMQHFTLIYEIKESQIAILNFWDNRQDRDQNEFLK